MLLEFVPTPDGGVGCQPIKQVGIRAPGGSWKYFRPSELPSRLRLAEEFGPGVLEASFHGFEKNEEFESLLVDRGIQIAIADIVEDHSVVTAGTRLAVCRTREFDDILYRAVSKVAMNYLIATAPGVARMPQLRPMRDYVLSARQPPWTPVDRGTFPIANAVPLQGHTLTLRYQPTGRLTARVSFFSTFTYNVTLSGDPFLVSCPSEMLTVGHFFDTFHKRVVRLTHASAVEEQMLLAVAATNP